MIVTFSGRSTADMVRVPVGGGFVTAFAAIFGSAANRDLRSRPRGVRLYSGYFASSSTISSSLATFATIEAAAMEQERASPCKSEVCEIGMSMDFASIRRCVGFLSRAEQNQASGAE